MIKVKVSHNFGDDFPLIRQTPGQKGIWGEFKFFINTDVDTCDYWVVFDGIETTEEVMCREGGKIFIAGEPRDIKTYRKKFLDQFDWVISSDIATKHSGFVKKQQSLPWLVGLIFDNHTGKKKAEYSKDYDELKEMHLIEKSKKLSVICSDKSDTEGQKMRLRFVQKLKEELGDDIDVFGRGHNPISDKWKAIAPYRYHICLENSATEDYWTEKLGDAFLGLSHPIYWGCKNIGEYFPEDAYTLIDITEPEQSIKKIKRLIDTNVYEEHLESLKEAKQLVLDVYNFFPSIVNFIKDQVPLSKEYKKNVIFPEQRSFLNDLIKRLHKIVSSKL